MSQAGNSTNLSSSSSSPVTATTGLQPSHHHNIQVEFAVNVNEPEDLDKIKELLKNDGCRLLSSDFERKTIQLEIDNKANVQLGSVQHLQELIEKETGFLAVIKGVGELVSAVSELRPSDDSIKDGSDFHGVVRLSQLSNNICYVDGSISSAEQRRLVKPSSLSLAVHEFGNLEGSGYSLIGTPIIDIISKIPNDGIFISKTISDCNVADMIGRSIALSRVSPETGRRTALSAGVVARASTVQQNKKQVCSCSGKTLWEERVERKKSEQEGGQ